MKTGLLVFGSQKDDQSFLWGKESDSHGISGIVLPDLVCTVNACLSRLITSPGGVSGACLWVRGGDTREVDCVLFLVSGCVYMCTYTCMHRGLEEVNSVLHSRFPVIESKPPRP